MSHPGKPGAGRMERVLDVLIRGGLLLIFILAPLPFGCVQPWAYSAMELGVLVVALLFLYRVFLLPSTQLHFPPLLLAPVALLLLTGLQLMPLSPQMLRVISPASSTFYGQTVAGYSKETEDIAVTDRAILGADATTPALWRPLSQVPAATRSYLLKGIAVSLFLFLLLNMFREAQQVRHLLYALVLGGTFQAFYGLLEYLSGHQHIFAYRKRYYLEAATGTFINRNHFAAFLEMALLAALGLLFSRLRSGGEAATWRERLLGLTDRRASLNLSLSLCVGILAVALILSYSRAGIVLGLMAAGGFCLIQLKQGWSGKKTLLVLLLVVAVFIPAYGVGYWTLTGRYAVLSEEFSAPGGRLAVWRRTVQIVRDFPVLGTGLGTFQHVFPRYRESTTIGYYDYAHNDYLQILAETGIAGGLVLLVGLGTLVRLRLRSAGRRFPNHTLSSACAFGLAAVGLHEVVDFGLQIPANLLAFALVAGCLTLTMGPEEPDPNWEPSHG